MKCFMCFPEVPQGGKEVSLFLVFQINMRLRREVEARVLRVTAGI